MAQSAFLEVMRQADIVPSDTVLDLGAHIGSFSLVVASERRCRVVGFEPDGDSIRLARANALINELEGLVEFHKVAVGGSDGHIRLHEATENWGHTIIDGGGPCNALTGRSVDVPIISLDRALDYATDDRCAFLKFNIEGAEFAMFERARPEVLRRIGAVVGEIHRDIGVGDVREIVMRLEAQGFVVRLVPQGPDRDILIAHNKSVFHPPEEGLWTPEQR